MDCPAGLTSMLHRWIQFFLSPDCKIPVFTFFGFYDQILHKQQDCFISVTGCHSGKAPTAAGCENGNLLDRVISDAIPSQ